MVQWEEPLFGCFRDCCSCIIISLCPMAYCVYQGISVKKATGESCLCACCYSAVLCCIGAAINRGKIRDRYLINGSCFSDCLLHCLCGPCAACQEYREVNVRESR
ncbi:unnamed protein product [Blepharisma stoltei]|uniref:Uncharacterized protein n=1 Tax=Blepharisma stoltei TaxID=1481888 RepID=A0AAU9JXS5_9CILI|nr:unnamed protein product [Blepharisma stoltei]